MDDMIICINCGWSNPEEASCCQKCGQSLRRALNESYSGKTCLDDSDFAHFSDQPGDNAKEVIPELICDRFQPSIILTSNSVNSIVIANDRLTDEEVCLKIYESKDFRTKEISLNEYKFLAPFKGLRILSPNYYGINAEGSPFYVAPVVTRLVSEYIGEIGFDFIERFLREISLTLKALKDKNISCGNLNPKTIALDRDGHFYLLPEAFSEICKHAITTGGNLRDSQNSYMAPEFFIGSNSTYPSAEGDIWAVGAIAYELITGVKPFGSLGGAFQRTNDSYRERFNFHSTEVVDFQRLLRLQYLIRRSLDMDAEQRPSLDFIFDSVSISVIKSQQIKGRYSMVHPIRRVIATIECDEMSPFTAQNVPGPGPLPPLSQYFIGSFYKKGETCGYLRLYDDSHIGKYNEMKVQEYNDRCRFT